jgi:hypothetical protein
MRNRRGKAILSRRGNKVALTRTNVLRVIESLCAANCIGPSGHEKGERCFPCEVFGIAHSVSSCHNGCPVKRNGAKEFEEAVMSGLY